jgi:hypothetical protein
METDGMAGTGLIVIVATSDGVGSAVSVAPQLGEIIRDIDINPRAM